MCENMVIQISTFGSCSSRNIFNSNINPNYKSFFNINHSVEALNMISLMSNPIDFDKKLLNSSNKYDNICIYEDLTKSYRDTLKNLNIDYLILDTYMDVNQPVYRYGDSFVSRSSRIAKIDFYKMVKDCEYINIFKNQKEYVELWTKAIDGFFNIINTCNPDVKVILNCSRMVYKYYDGNELIVNNDFRKKALKRNLFRDKLDKIILQNYDVEVLPFDMTTLSDVNHIFNVHPLHYEKRYYLEKNKQILEIDKRNKELGFNNEFNVNFRRVARENMIAEFDKNRLRNQIRKKNKEIKKLKQNNNASKSKNTSVLKENSRKITKSIFGIANFMKK